MGQKVEQGVLMSQFAHRFVRPHRDIGHRSWGKRKSEQAQIFVILFLPVLASFTAQITPWSDLTMCQCLLSETTWNILEKLILSEAAF